MYLSVGLSAEVEVEGTAVDLSPLAAPAEAVAVFETITTTNFLVSMLQSLILVSSLSIFPV